MMEKQKDLMRRTESITTAASLMGDDGITTVCSDTGGDIQDDLSVSTAQVGVGSVGVAQGVVRSSSPIGSPKGVGGRNSPVDGGSLTRRRLPCPIAPRKYQLMVLCVTPCLIG